MKSRILLILIQLLFADSIFAQSEATSAADEAFRKADAELNCIYLQVLNKLPEKSMKSFIEAERAWLKYRDADSIVFAEITSQGGSAYATDRLGNLAEMTQARVIKLRNLLSLL